MSFEIYNYLFIAIGLFTIWGAVAKPNFYWNSRRAVRLRKFIGEGGAMIFYLVLGLALILVGVLSLTDVITLIQ